MQNFAGEKFCEKYFKYVIDLIKRTDDQIQKVIKQTQGKEIYRRIFIKPISAMSSRIILITNLILIQAQSKNDFGIPYQTMNHTKDPKTHFKRTKKEILNTEVFFIHKSKNIKTTTDKNGNFVLEIPSELIEAENLLYFNYEINTYKNTAVIFIKMKNKQ